MVLNFIKQYKIELFAVLLITIAFGFSVSTTWDLNWPPRWDFYRELGAINTILDGYRGCDPLYVGESNWYNPLVPELVAFLSRFSTLDIPAFFTRVGSYLNLLTPIAFFFFVRRTVSPSIGVLALAIFLFWIPQNIPTNTTGLYSPWLWPRNFAIGLFFSCTYSFLIAMKDGKWIWTIVSGVLLGLTFLAHTAPALILTFSITIYCIWQSIADEKNNNLEYLLKLLLIGTVAFIVSFHYLYSIFIVYKFKIINSAPSDYLGITLREALRGAVTLRTFLATFGLCYIIFRKEFVKGEQRRWLLIIFFTTLSFFIYGMIFGVLQKYGIKLFQIVPAYHFHMYLKCFEAIFAAVGIWLFVEAGSKYVSLLLRKKNIDAFSQKKLITTMFVFICLLFLLNLPSYKQSDELKLFRQESLKREESVHLNSFYDWARKETKFADVFLSDNRYGLFAVSPTARKVVAIYDFYSNPYVDFKKRNDARRAIFEAIRQQKYVRFLALAKENNVTYVIDAKDADENYRFSQPLPEPEFTAVFNVEPMTVYRVNYSQ